jgi:hypothetical protein
MYAHVGDRLIIEGDPGRTGIIIGTPHEDGSPPYVVRWLANGHIAMVSPGQFARIVPAQQRSSECRTPSSEPSHPLT